MPVFVVAAAMLLEEDTDNYLVLEQVVLAALDLVCCEGLLPMCFELCDHEVFAFRRVLQS